MVRAFICPSESSIERVKVCHVIVECRVINHHPAPRARHYIYYILIVSI